eukprot:403360333
MQVAQNYKEFLKQADQTPSGALKDQETLEYFLKTAAQLNILNESFWQKIIESILDQRIFLHKKNLLKGLHGLNKYENSIKKRTNYQELKKDIDKATRSIKKIQKKIEQFIILQAQNLVDNQIETITHEEYSHIVKWLADHKQDIIVEKYLEKISKFKPEQFSVANFNFILHAVRVSANVKPVFKHQSLQYVFKSLKTQQFDISQGFKVYVKSVDFKDNDKQNRNSSEVTSLQITTMLKILEQIQEQLKKDSRNNDLIFQLANVAELASLRGIQRIDDPDFLYMILNNLANISSNHQLIYQQHFISLVMINVGQDINCLNGRVIKSLSKLGISDIDFWLYIEEQYLKIIEKEQQSDLVEALVGLAIIKRGTTVLYQQIQQKLLQLIDELKGMDICRTYFAISQIPIGKQNQDLISNLIEKINEKYNQTQSEGKLEKKLHYIDLLNILQGECNFGFQNEFIIEECQRLLLLMIKSKKESKLDPKISVNIFTIFQKLYLNYYKVKQTDGDSTSISANIQIPKPLINEDLELMLLDHLLNEFSSYQLDQFQQCIAVLKRIDEQQFLEQLREHIFTQSQQGTIDSFQLKSFLECF